jgi:predicted PurR-regulated permease PerM
VSAANKAVGSLHPLPELGEGGTLTCRVRVLLWLPIIGAGGLLANGVRATALIILRRSEYSGQSGTTGAMFLPRHATSREWLRAGFFAALGASLLCLLAWLLWQFASAVLVICAPFVVGLVLALLLDPLADFLERRGLPRFVAVSIIFAGFLLLLVGIGFVLVPALINEASKLRLSAPSDLDKVKVQVTDWLKSHKNMHVAGTSLPNSYNALTQQLSTKAGNYFNQSTGGVEAFLTSTATMLLEIIVTLIVTFFLLLDIDKLRARFFFLLPEKARAPTKQISTDIGGVFADYLRGLLVVCTLYGFATTIMLYGLSFTNGHASLASYALLVGTAAGVLYAVPYLGSLTMGGVTFIVAFSAGGIGFALWACALLLVINQIFDNIITPRVVGGGVGLHPVVAIFALFVGGALFHIWGMLLSVPITASIQVILFRIFPRLTDPTPAPFLRAQGIPLRKIKTDGETAKSGAGDHPEVPQGRSVLSDDDQPSSESPAAQDLTI